MAYIVFTVSEVYEYEDVTFLISRMPRSLLRVYPDDVIELRPPTGAWIRTTALGLYQAKMPSKPDGPSYIVVPSTIKAADVPFRTEVWLIDQSVSEARHEANRKELQLIEARQKQWEEARKQNPWGDQTFAGCARPKRVWGNSATGTCSFCGTPLSHS